MLLGTVIAEAGRHSAAAHLLYVSSHLLDLGQSQGATMSGESDPVSIGDNGDGTLSVSGYDATSFGERLLQDADEATRHQAWERVTAQSAAAFMTPTRAADRAPPVRHPSRPGRRPGAAAVAPRVSTTST